MLSPNSIREGASNSASLPQPGPSMVEDLFTVVAFLYAFQWMCYSILRLLVRFVQQPYVLIFNISGWLDDWIFGTRLRAAPAASPTMPCKKSLPPDEFARTARNKLMLEAMRKVFREKQEEKKFRKMVMDILKECADMAKQRTNATSTSTWQHALREASNILQKQGAEQTYDDKDRVIVLLSLALLKELDKSRALFEGAEEREEGA